LAHPEGRAQILSYGPFAGKPNILQRIIQSLSSQILTSQLVSLKFLISAIALKETRDFMLPILNHIIEMAINSCEKSDKKVQDNLLIFLFNWGVCITENPTTITVYDILSTYIEKIRNSGLNEQQTKLLLEISSKIKK